MPDHFLITIARLTKLQNKCLYNSACITHIMFSVKCQDARRRKIQIIYILIYIYIYTYRRVYVRVYTYIETFSANQKSLGAPVIFKPQTVSHCVQLPDTAAMYVSVLTASVLLIYR